MSLNDVVIFLLLWTVCLTSEAVKSPVFIAISLVQKGAVAIVGPQSVLTFEAIQRLCVQLDVPQIAIKVSGLASSFINPCNNEYVLRMSPADLPQLRGIVEFIKHFGWKKVAVIASYDKSAREGIQDFVNSLTENDITLTTPEYFNIPSTEYPGDYTNPHLESKLNRIKHSGARVIVLKCGAQQATQVLEKAWSLGLTENHAWILTDSAVDESHILPNESFPVSMTGLIGFRQSVGRGLLSEHVRLLWKQSGNTGAITASAGRVFDAVRVLASGMQMAINNGLSLDNHLPAQDFCNVTQDMKSRDMGKRLSKFLRKVQINGFMNFLSFDSKGYPSQAIYDVINYQGNKLVKVGNWTISSGLEINQQSILWPSNTPNVPREIANTLKNKTIRVVTFVGSPFSMLKSYSSASKEEFEGAAIDILDELSRILGFSYTIYLSPDGKAGVENPGTGEWNGAIKEIMEKKADLAVGPITINPAREKVVDFTKPFLTSGLGTVMAVDESPIMYFRFLSPFHIYLWSVIIISIFGMAVVNWVLSRLSPFGYYGRCAQARRKVSKQIMAAKNNLSFLNSLWSSAAYYLGQGPDGNHPVSGSGRVAVAVWWFCITILGATYTANLAAYLTQHRLQTPIRSVGDLIQQTSTEYGVVQDSQTQRFFATSVIPRYQMMWEFMKLRRTLQSSTSEGLTKVELGKFAFIHDQPLLLYKSRKEHCGKMKVLEGTFGEAHYGFALPTNSPYTAPLSIEMLELRNKGEVSRIIDKWMIDKTPCKALDEDDTTEITDTSSMGVVNMLGVFIFMLAGTIVGGFILIIEWIIAACKDINRWNPEAPHTFFSALKRRLSASSHTSKRVVFIKPASSYRKSSSLSSKSKIEYKLPLGRHGSTEL
ncbi:glutamate receptor ionotropic, kainate 2-like isoform X2 [Oculina patagonica]